MRKRGVILAATALLLLAGCATPSAGTTEPVQIRQIADAPPALKTPTPTPSAEAVIEVAPEPVIEQTAPEPAPDPVLCPEGTIAGAVDDYGNESSCYELSDDGEQCVEYNDANECTAWYRP
jgi:hypothetical protein